MSGTALVLMPATSLPAWASESPNPARSSPVAMPGRYRFFWSSLPAMSTGPTGSRVNSSIKAAVFEYLATSSMATVRPRMPAPDPPSSVGRQSPSRSASRKASKMSDRVLTGRVDLPSPRPDLVLGQAPDALLEGSKFG